MKSSKKHKVDSNTADDLEIGKKNSNIIGEKTATKFRNKINEDINNKEQGTTIYGGTIDKNNIAQARICDIAPIYIYISR